MWLVPSRAQWASWSLPSKLTAIGAYAGIVGILLAVGLSAISAVSQERAESRAQHTAERVVAHTSEAANPGRVTSAATSEPSREPDSLALDDLLIDLNRNDLSDLQREQMRERLAGRRVTWRVHVKQVARIYGERVLLVFIAPSQQSKSSPALLSAVFSAAHESSLSVLRPGDFAVVEGSLGFERWGLSDWLPELGDAELLSFSSPPKPNPTPAH